MFEPAFQQKQSDRDNALWFIIRDGLLLVKKNCRPASVPQGHQLADILPRCDHVQLLATLTARPALPLVRRKIFGRMRRLNSKG